MNKINLILPAAGLGSRFRDIGETRPKPLIPIFDYPMIMWVLLNFPLKPTDKAWVISQEKDGLPQALAGITHILPFEIEFIEINGLTQGPASTVSLVLNTLNDEEGLIVANSDQFVFTDLTPFVEKVRTGHSDGQILTMLASSNAWSYVGRDLDGKINKVVEKVEISNEATVGVYGWSKVAIAKKSFNDTFERNIKTNNEYYVAPTYNYLIEQGFKIESYLVGRHGKDVHGLGIPSDLESFLKIEKARQFAINMHLRLNLDSE